jgi:hypothetical protein
VLFFVLGAFKAVVALEVDVVHHRS